MRHATRSLTAVLALAIASVSMLQGCADETSPPEETVADEPAPGETPAGTSTDGGEEKEVVGEGPTTPSSPAEETAAVISSGMFVDKDHKGSGNALMLEPSQAGAAHYLRLESFSTEPGPALHVLLTKHPSPSSAADVAEGSLDLGPLRATKGNLTYEIPAGTDVTQYAGVIVYCVDFSVVFTAATLVAR